MKTGLFTGDGVEIETGKKYFLGFDIGSFNAHDPARNLRAYQCNGFTTAQNGGSPKVRTYCGNSIHASKLFSTKAAAIFDLANQCRDMYGRALRLGFELEAKGK